MVVLEVADDVSPRDTNGTGCLDRTVALEENEGYTYMNKDNISIISLIYCSGVHTF